MNKKCRKDVSVSVSTRTKTQIDEVALRDPDYIFFSFGIEILFVSMKRIFVYFLYVIATSKNNNFFTVKSKRNQFTS